MPIMGVPLLPTGRLDPTPNVAAAGAWTEARWRAEVQEASERPLAVVKGRSNVVRIDGLDWRIRRCRDDPAAWSGGERGR